MIVTKNFNENSIKYSVNIIKKLTFSWTNKFYNPKYFRFSNYYQNGCPIGTYFYILYEYICIIWMFYIYIYINFIYIYIYIYIYI